MMTLPSDEFIRRFLIHVLPRGANDGTANSATLNERTRLKTPLRCHGTQPERAARAVHRCSAGFLRQRRPVHDWLSLPTA
jgi:hypothetical protein